MLAVDFYADARRRAPERTAGAGAGGGGTRALGDRRAGGRWWESDRRARSRVGRVDHAATRAPSVFTHERGASAVGDDGVDERRQVQGRLEIGPEPPDRVLDRALLADATPDLGPEVVEGDALGSGIEERPEDGEPLAAQGEGQAVVRSERGPQMPATARRPGVVGTELVRCVGGSDRGRAADGDDPSRAIAEQQRDFLERLTEEILGIATGRELDFVLARCRGSLLLGHCKVRTCSMRAKREVTTPSDGGSVRCL